MATVKIRHIRLRRYAKELTETAGSISMVRRQGSLNAGSLGLNHVSAIMLTPNIGAAALPANARGIAGSVRDPDSTMHNTVALRSFIAGTTGTRLANLAMIGSTPVAGTVSAHFIALGY